MKLIDILNKIANGELKEGTKFVYRGNMYIWKYNAILNTTNLDAFDIAYRADLNMEIELIEPDHFPNVGKMAEPTDNTNLELYNSHFIMGKIIATRNKLNEVIRYINKED